MTEYEYWAPAEPDPHGRSDTPRYTRVDPALLAEAVDATIAWEYSEPPHPRCELRELTESEYDPPRTWAGSVNHRIAQDEVLASLRREAFFRAQQIDIALDRQEAAEWLEVNQRIERGRTIPERPVRFSWMDGPA